MKIQNQDSMKILGFKPENAVFWTTVMNTGI